MNLNQAKGIPRETIADAQDCYQHVEMWSVSLAKQILTIAAVTKESCAVMAVAGSSQINKCW